MYVLSGHEEETAWWAPLVGIVRRPALSFALGASVV